MVIIEEEKNYKKWIIAGVIILIIISFVYYLVFIRQNGKEGLLIEDLLKEESEKYKKETKKLDPEILNEILEDVKKQQDLEDEIMGTE